MEANTDKQNQKKKRGLIIRFNDTGNDSRNALSFFCMRKKNSKLLAVFLCLVLCITLLPFDSFAEPSEAPENMTAEKDASAPESEEAIYDNTAVQGNNEGEDGGNRKAKDPLRIKESLSDAASKSKDILKNATSETAIMEESTESSTTFDIGDDKKLSVFHGAAVRFEDESGELVDYDPALVMVEAGEVTSQGRDLSEYSYRNKEGDKKQYFPEKLSQCTPILMEYGDYSISFAPTKATKTKFIKGNTLASPVKESRTTIYGDEEKAVLNAEYISETGDTSFAYESHISGIKETITLETAPKTGIFSFELNLDGSVAKKGKSGTIGFYGKYENNVDKLVGGMGSAFMNDATGDAYSKDISYDLEKMEGKEDSYILTMKVSEDYLNAPEREYPVIIDPTISWIGENDITEATVNESYPDYNYSNDWLDTLITGRMDDELFRSYIRFEGLEGFLAGKRIDDAVLDIGKYAREGDNQWVDICKVDWEWDEKIITWQEMPSYSACYAGNSLGKKYKRIFNLYEYAEDIANGTIVDNGLALVLYDENEEDYESGSCGFGEFYGSRWAEEDERPALYITYDSPPPVPAVPPTAGAMSISFTDNNPPASGKKWTKDANPEISFSGFIEQPEHPIIGMYFQYAIKEGSSTPTSKDYKAANSLSYSKQGDAYSGTFRLTPSDRGIKSGEYNIYFRACNTAGQYSEPVDVPYNKDSDAPDIGIKTLVGGIPATTLSGIVKLDLSLSDIAGDVITQSSIKLYKDIGNGIPEGVGKDLCPPGFTADKSIDFDTSDYGNGSYVLRFEAEDYAGNKSAVSKTVTIYNTYSIPAGFRIKRPLGSGNKPLFLFSSGARELTLEAPQGGILPGNIKWFIDENLFGSGTSFADNFSPPYYEMDRQYKIFAVGQDSSTGLLSFSNNIIKDYESIGLGEYVNEGSKYVDFEKGAAIFRIDVEHPENLDYIKIAYGKNKWDEVAPGEECYIYDFAGEYIYDEIRIDIESAGGGDGLDLGEVTLNTYVLEDEYFQIYDDAVLMQAPTNIKESGYKNYKTYISWDNEIAEQMPTSLCYQVHRSTQLAFAPTDDTLVADNVRAGYYSEMLTGYTGKLYYKVCAVKKLENGISHRGAFSNEISLDVSSADEFESRTGIKDIWEYAELGTPVGTGYLEKSGGNFCYEQTDINIENETVPVEFTRAYNSKMTEPGSFGKGFTHNFDKSLIMVTDGNNSIDTEKILLRDMDGAIYEFNETATNSGIYSPKSVDFIELKKLDTASSMAIKIPERTPGAQGDQTYKNISFYYDYILKDKGLTQYLFNDNGQLVCEVDSNGNFLYLEHDADTGLLYRVSTSRNVALEFLYGDDNDGIPFVDEVLLPDGGILNYSYSGKGNNRTLSSVKKLSNKNDGTSIAYNYSYTVGVAGGKKLNGIFDAEGNKYEVGYSGEIANRLTFPEGEELSFTYENSGNGLSSGETRTTSQRKIGNMPFGTEAYVFDKAKGLLKKYTDALGEIATYTYMNDDQIETCKWIHQYQTMDPVTGVITNQQILKTETTAYTSEGAIKKITDGDGGTITYSYGTTISALTEQPTSEIEKDYNGGTVSNTKNSYDENGNQTDENNLVSDENGGFAYNDEGELTKEEYDIDGVEVSKTEYSYLYYPNGKSEVTTIETEGTSVITSTAIYDAMGNETYSKDSTGFEEGSTYDGFGRMIKTVITEGGIVTTESSTYNNNGTLITETDIEGLKTSYGYDSRNRLISETRSKENESQTFTTVYGTGSITPKGGIQQGSVNVQTTEEKDSGGNTVSKSYIDMFGNPVRETQDGLSTDYTYTNSGDTLTECEVSKNGASGLVSLSLTDDKGNCYAEILNPEVSSGKYKIGTGSITTKQEFYPDGSLKAEIDALNNRTEFTLDEQKRITSVKTPDQNTTKYKYIDADSKGNSSVTTTDARGNKSVEIKDVRGLNTGIIDQGDGSLDPIERHMEYDETKDLLVLEDDGVGDLDSGYKEYFYDSKDRLVSVESGYYEMKGKSKKSKALKLAPYYFTDFTYDISGDITSMEDYNDIDESGIARHTEYSYDYLKRLAGYSEIDILSPSTGEINAAMTNYSYDPLGNITDIDYPASVAGQVRGLNFEYDSNKWLIKGYAKAAGGKNLLIEYVYDDFGKVTAIKDYRAFDVGSLGEYIQKSYSYDIFGRLTAICVSDSQNPSVIKEQYSYQYDKNSNIITESIENDYPSNNSDKTNLEKNYFYDEIGRLKTTGISDITTGTQAAINYSYDSVGNMLTETSVTTSGSIPISSESSYSYNSLDQLTERVITDAGILTGDFAYLYDFRGNQVSIYDWASGVETEMEYDPEDRLIGFTTTDGAIGFSQKNSYNGNGQMIRKVEESSTGGNTSTNYYYQGSSVLYTTDAGGSKTSFNFLDTDDDIIATERPRTDMPTSSYYYFYNKDIRDSTTNLINASGDAVVSYDYSDFGETVIKGDFGFYNEICYTGGIYDKSTELYYLNARFYDPDDKRFITQDTYRGEQTDPCSWNLYAYCKNSPLSYSDSTGHKYKKVHPPKKKQKKHKAKPKPKPKKKPIKRPKPKKKPKPKAKPIKKPLKKKPNVKKKYSGLKDKNQIVGSTHQVTITHYCKCKTCCGKWYAEKDSKGNWTGSKTASGVWPKEGVTIANNFWAFGTKVQIDKSTYTVQDTGGTLLNDGRIDIFIESHKKALNLGIRKNVTVKIV